MTWNNIKELSDDKENVKKYVFSKSDAVVESVLYRYPSYEERTVICCSTQSGCPVGCRFCGTGDYFVRSLTCAEIVSQPKHLLDNIGINPSEIKKLQIMFMSMGEPMYNYDNLESAIRILNKLYPNAKLLISTSAPQLFNNFLRLQDLSYEIENVGLQFSVHESSDEARKKLIPTKTCSLEMIAQLGEDWYDTCGRKPYFNYCVSEKNNTQEDVDRLYALFNPNIWEATISVICERNENVAAANKRQEELAGDFMQKMLLKGYSTRMFNPAGQDTISGGCGQLWHTQAWFRENPTLCKKSGGWGLPKIHAPRLIPTSE
jgi:23S rRNA (adenine2503-C2)-methyltransferase